MKTCKTCGLVLPVADFSPHKRSKDGLRGECKKCNSAANRAWRESNRDRVKTRRDEWRASNLDRDRGYSREYNRKKREEAITALGGKCSGCGNDDPRVLQIDHIDGGGGADRKNGRMAILNKAIAGDPSLQLLCANCHCIKTFENGDHLTKTGD